MESLERLESKLTFNLEMLESLKKKKENLERTITNLENKIERQKYQQVELVRRKAIDSMKELSDIALEDDRNPEQE